MTGLLIGVSLGVALLVGLVVLRPTPIDRAARRAVATQDAASLVAAIEAMPCSARPSAYNQAIKAIWDRYERPLAISVIRAMAVHGCTATITQYWVRQALEVEPELAQASFDEEFLATYYRPEQAAKCGGGCGCGH